MVNVISVDEAHSYLSGALHRRVCDVQLGHGSFITMSFHSLVDSRDVDYFLWVYCTGWNLTSASKLLSASEDERTEIATSISALESSYLELITIDWPSMSMALAFSGGLTLTTASVFSMGYEHWMWKLPSSDWLVAGPGSTLSIETR